MSSTKVYQLVVILLILVSCAVTVNSLISSSTNATASTKVSPSDGQSVDVWPLTNTNFTNHTQAKAEVSPQQCFCMEQWNCTLSNGEVSSYCGSANADSSGSPSQVCCVLSNQIELNSSIAKAVLKSDQLVQLLESSAHAAAAMSKAKIEIPPVQYKRASTSTPNSKRVSCGQSLNGGNADGVARFKEWPWHVAILEAKGDLYICGGSFLENDVGQQLVLTAAHCVTNYASRPNTKTLKRLKVRLGEFDVTTNAEPLAHVEVLVKAIELHPRFKNNGYLQNDIAILRLNNSVRLQNRDNIRPICLPGPRTQVPPSGDVGKKTRTEASNDFNVSSCVVTGWGRKYEHSAYSVRLKEIPIPLWEHKACEDKLRVMFGPGYTLSPDVLCAGGNEESDTCDGDGGGPLVCFDHDKDTWVQQGIVSWGIGCGRNNPGIYTRVSSYMSWI